MKTLPSELPYFDYGTERQYFDQQIFLLQRLKNNDEYLQRIKNFKSTPMAPELAAKAIQTFVLSALLTPLRQVVGSCFATAPAIDIQRNHIDLFLDDMESLLYRGQIVRVIAGQEHVAPMSGVAFKDLPFDQALLRAWEYTLACFCDYKVDFYRYNLIAALGMDSKEPDGIGQLVFDDISQKLEKKNTEIDSHQRDLDEAYGQMKVAENFFGESGSLDAMRRHKAQWKMQSYQFQSAKDRRDEAHDIAKHYAQFFKYVMENYASYFSEFFQEVYDPSLGTCKASLFEDRPAGFRLVYKHGRRDPTAWTLVTHEKEYIEVLIDFFRMVEGRLIADCDWEEGKSEIVAITTLIIQHLGDQAFLKTATDRVRELHKKAQTGAADVYPWSYILGGSMQALLKCYFRNESSIPTETQIVSDPQDLLVFFIETMKNIPDQITTPFISNDKRAFYAYSPSHAFLLLPGLEGFKKAWTSQEFTYTWVRDHIVKPGIAYYSDHRLSQAEQEFVVAKIAEEEGIKVLALHGSMTVSQLRAHFVSQGADPTAIDSCLMRMLPLYSQSAAQRTLHHLGLVVDALPEYLTACELADLAYALTKDEQIRIRLSTLGYLPPQPLFVGDTNWPGLWFAFAYNPGLERLDLWRCDPSFRRPKPMHIWEDDLDGSSQQPWGILARLF